MMNNLQIVVLAAGHGTRMKSELPKICHFLGGRPVLYYVLDLAQHLHPQETILVVSPSLKGIKTPFQHQTIVQDSAQGTGDAVKCALPHLKPEGHVLVLYGDTPLIQKETLHKMIALCQEYPKTAVTVLGMRPHKPENYGRLILNQEKELEEIIEEKDLSSSQKSISLCNSGVMLIRGDLLDPLLKALTCHNAGNEYYLTDIIQSARQKGYTCRVVEGEALEFVGINTRQDLAQAESTLQTRWRDKAMNEGVTLLDPQTTYFSYDTKIASDVRIHPCVVFGPEVVIEKGAEILSFCQISKAFIGPHALVGPFAHLRGGVHLEEEVEIGNFVEVKKSRFRSKAKAKHLSYIGDADVGSKTNVGAGTITCNYDGFNKFETRIGENVSIGSNSSLVAPLSIGDDAIIGAGSVITQNIKSRDLVISRSEQKAFEKGADKYREKRVKGKDS
jgi:bifunctional UDP-N-acetylglucosamine pyrophosphorylase / glucosamine-1-phosphate N-acetyltransferase